MLQYIETFKLNQRLVTSISTITLLIPYTSEKDFKTHISRTKEWFLARGYSEIVFNIQMDKVLFGRGQSVKTTLESGITFVTTYHPEVKELG